MKLESSPMGESNSGMSQILSQLTSLSPQVEDMKKEKGKYKREYIWCINASQRAMPRSIVPYFMSTLPLEIQALLKRLLYLGVRYVEINITLVNAST
jgi:hypothetical protein